MTDTTPTPRAIQLLDQVYEALLKADYAALSGISAQMEQEFRNPNSTLTDAQWKVVRHKAERNGACLISAQRGVKAARRRLAEIRSTATGLVTYDRSGRRAEVTENRHLAQRF
jgi:plasmid stabilization system protein ParE